MKEYTIIKCKECGRLFKIYPYQVYMGDPEYCPECNRKVNQDEQKYNPK